MNLELSRSAVAMLVLSGLVLTGCGSSGGQGGTGGNGATGGGGGTAGIAGTGGASGQGGSSQIFGCGKTCADFNYACGQIYDGCDLILDCGACSVDYACGIDGTPGRCGTASKWVVAVDANYYDIHGIWGSAANDVWAVDDDGQVLYWDGSTWAIVSRTGGALRAVNGTSASNVYMAGDGGTVLKLGGGMLTPLPKQGNDFTGLWVGSANQVWAADGWYVSYWNGSYWNSAQNNTADTTVLWGSADGRIWGAGKDGGLIHLPAGSLATEILRDPAASTRSVFFAAIWGVDTNSIWAVGDAIWRWNGTKWMELGYANGLDSFRGVWASSSGNVWVVGDNGAIYHGDGYSFTRVPSPTSYNLYAIWGSGPRDIWAVGEGGIILHYGQ